MTEPTSRVSPDRPVPGKERFEPSRNPSLGKPVRTVINDSHGKPMRVEWVFPVVMGGKSHALSVDERNLLIKNKKYLTLSFDISTGDMSKPEIEREVALGVIMDTQSKFSRMDTEDAKKAYDDLQNATKLHVIRIKEDKKGPTVALCTIWQGPNDDLYMLFHEKNKEHQVYKVHFDKGRSITEIMEDLKEAYHRGGSGSSEVREATWKSYFSGIGVKGTGMLRLDAKAKEQSHEEFKGEPGYEDVEGYARHTKADRIHAMPYTEAPARTAGAAQRAGAVDATAHDAIVPRPGR